jgi:hypothetical protein
MASIEGSANHLAFSSFSHINDLSSISYAVGLREDDADSEAIIGRILPMARPKPGKPIEKRQPKVAEGPMADCDNPECIARQDRYRELGDANSGMRSQYEELEMQLKLTLNKLQLMDKSNKVRWAARQTQTNYSYRRFNSVFTEP